MPGSGHVHVMVLHRQRLVAEASASAVASLAPDLVVEVGTSAYDALQGLDRLDVLIADETMLPQGVSWGSRGAPDSALCVALGSAEGIDPVNETLAALRAGASAWLPADALPGLVLHVVRAVVEGDMWVPAELVGSVLQRLIAAPRTAVDDQDLSPRERTVLDLVAAGRTNREIAAQLHLSPNTVRTHRQRLFRKIDVHSAVQAASWLRGTRADRSSPPGPTLRSDHP
ncbi:MAG: DNA-binding response regulator [Frankiales bacterium]|nr:DNA-binding response regulator [Frankiales bacterium]